MGLNIWIGQSLFKALRGRTLPFYVKKYTLEVSGFITFTTFGCELHEPLNEKNTDKTKSFNRFLKNIK